MKSHRPNPAFRHQGFTLIEALISLTLLGILTFLFGGTIGSALSLKKTADQDRQSFTNQAIGGVLLDYARTISATGQLPAPINSGAVRYGIYDADANLFTLLTQARIGRTEINGDGLAADNVRVYQLIDGLTQTVPLIAQSGPAVTLTYQQAAIYSTACPRAGTCNTVGGPGGIPGVSGIYQASNLSTWGLTGTDYGLTMISTFALQRQMLNVTVDRLYTIRDKMALYVAEKQRAVAASDTTNYYPRPTVAAPASQMGTTTDCHNSTAGDGWYRLDNSNILTQIGLSTTEHGKTAWGGQIHFCPDYDIAGTAGNDQPPHYAALRISNTPVTTLNPTGSATNIGNVVIVF